MKRFRITFQGVNECLMEECPSELGEEGLIHVVKREFIGLHVLIKMFWSRESKLKVHLTVNKIDMEEQNVIKLPNFGQ